ncbi:MAG: transcriptional regulator [Xanthobacteraceae bacterium]
MRERQRLAAEEGVIALAEYEANDIAVRKNMAKLRALRLAKEAAASAETSVKPMRKTRKK